MRGFGITMKTSDCKTCYKYQERAAIIEHDGVISRDKAETLARFEVCVGCDGVRGVGLFDKCPIQ